MTKPLILIVEDDPASREAMDRLFRKKGWDVLAVGSVAAARRKLAPLPDCVIVDLALPGGDGEQLLEVIETLPRKPCTVVLTAIDDPPRHQAIRERFRPAGIFLKPADVPAVLKICDQAKPKPEDGITPPLGAPKV